MTAFWIILTGALLAASSGILGSFLLLRKMAMIGDAISHAVLPGIALAYLIAGFGTDYFLLLGAALFGMLTTLTIQWLSKKIKMQNDASIGVTFTFLFALGIILITAFASQIDLDQECVLYGEIAYVPLDLVYTMAGNSIGPRQVWILGINLLIVIIAIVVGWRGWMISSFNEEHAQSLGINTSIWHYSLMMLVSLTTVVSFESVGAILVVAFLVIPPATAYLLSDKLENMVLLSVFIGVLSSLLGYWFAWILDSSIAASMAVSAGLLFLLALFLRPKEGIFIKWIVLLSKHGRN
jgi:manganese/zinc/iron transport system permease protein